MQITLTPEEQTNLEKQVQTCRQVRSWKRYQALLLLAEALPPEQVAMVLHCRRASVYNWAAAWSRKGRGALTEPPHGGRPADLDPAALELLDHWLEEGNPQQRGYAAANWTVPLLQTQLGQSGYQVSQKTVRRALHRLGVAKNSSQVRVGAARSRFRSKKTALAERAQLVIAAGGQVWTGDESTLREFPPLRAAWSRKGRKLLVEISGRNSRRAIHAALTIQTGQLVRILRERHRQEAVIAFIGALGEVAPSVPKLLIWDNAPAHHPKRVLQAAHERGIEMAFLPYRSPELNPCEDLWRGIFGEIAANRTYASMEELGERALAWIDALSPADVLRRSGLLSSKFHWLVT